MEETLYKKCFNYYAVSLKVNTQKYNILILFSHNNNKLYEIFHYKHYNLFLKICINF